MEWECKEIDKYIVLNKVIGKGNQATVYEAYRKDNLQIVAAKVFDLSQNGSTNQSRNLQRQVKILTTLKHPYILECFDIKQTQKNQYFFLEYCDGGDLEKYLKDKQLITESECLDLLKQIVSAFQMLEKKNIVHRDLKPANILLKNGQLKIADFGFAKEIQDDVQNTIVGSPIFMCPQALDGTGVYDLKKGDVWSAGVCLYLMLYGVYPFYASNVQNLIETLKKQDLFFRDDLNKRSEAVKDLLSHMLDKDEAKRYTWDQVASHKCLNAGSHYQNNPLLGSLEMNQVSGISSFNSDYKNVELRQQNEQKSTQIQIPQTPNNQQQNQSNVSIYKRRDNTNQLKQIHLLFRLLTQFALTYRIIWKGFFQLIVAQQQGTIYFKTDSIVNAVFLLMNSLLLKEHKFLRELIQNPKQFITFRIQRNKLENITEEDLIHYFNSEIYKSFMQNITTNFQQDTQVSLMNYSEMFQAQLIAAGFQNVITEDKCNEYIGCSLNIINQNIQQMSQDALNQDNKTYITLLLYLFFLQKDEKRLQSFTNPLEHYQKLQKYMEDINFTSKQQIYDQIQQYIATDLNSKMDEEDDDEDEEEDENLSLLINKYT
ncbi:hypothetical protein ABPG73_013207 [Tetrahymena malaccensis]